MLAPAPRDATSPEVASILNNPAHPFSLFVHDHLTEVTVSLQRHNIGAIVTSGQTGVEVAARRISNVCEIPHTGFAPIGYINDTGNIPPEIALTMMTQDDGAHYIPPDLLLNDSQIAAEIALSPYARERFYEQSSRLNRLMSSAVLVLCYAKGSPDPFAPATYNNDEGPGNYYRLYLDQITPQALGDVRWWLSLRKPVLLNITGPRENCEVEGGELVRERALTVLSEMLRSL